jgi:hypothetical protein
MIDFNLLIWFIWTFHSLKRKKVNKSHAFYYITLYSMLKFSSVSYKWGSIIKSLKYIYFFFCDSMTFITKTLKKSMSFEKPKILFWLIRPLSEGQCQGNDNIPHFWTHRSLKLFSQHYTPYSLIGWIYMLINKKCNIY